MSGISVLRFLSISTSFACLLIASPASAQHLVGDGLEMVIPTLTLGTQSEPDIARDGAGNFVVVWTSSQLGTTNSDSIVGIQGHRFDASGDRIGEQFQVNTQTLRQQVAPAISMAPDGGFVVVWQSDYEPIPASPYFDENIEAQLFDAAGNMIGAQFRVNTYTPTDQLRPDVAMRDDGSFLVVWESLVEEGEDTIQGRLYDSLGMPLTDQFQVNTTTFGDQFEPTVKVAPAGGFLVVWDDVSARGQVVGANGALVGAELLLGASGSARDVDVSFFDDGGFVAAWADGDLFARRFDSFGTAIGAEISLPMDYSVKDPALRTHADGRFDLVWSDQGAQGAEFDAAGNLVVQYRVNALGGTTAVEPEVIGDTADGLFAVWKARFTAFDNDGVFLRRFVPATFVDGFESGDLTAWSEVDGGV